MNIDKIHLVTSPFKEDIDGEICTKTYFFGVNILEITYTVSTGEIKSMIFNYEDTDFKDSNIISKLNEHLDKYNSQVESFAFNNIAYMHISGLTSVTRENENDMEIYLNAGDNQYLFVYEKETGTITKINENEKNIPVDDKESLDLINKKLDEIRYENYLRKKDFDKKTS